MVAHVIKEGDERTAITFPCEGCLGFQTAETLALPAKSVIMEKYGILKIPINFTTDTTATFKRVDTEPREQEWHDYPASKTELALKSILHEPSVTATLNYTTKWQVYNKSRKALAAAHKVKCL